MHSFGKDVSYSLRVLRRYPGISLIAVCSLVLGVAANSTMFSLVDAMYLRPFAVRDPGALVWIGMRTAEGQREGIAWAEYLEVRHSVSAFADIAVQNRRGTMLERDGVSELVPLTIVSDNFFSMLGIRASRGRLFQGELDATLVDEPAVALSDAAWRRYFGADPSTVGRTVRIGNRACTVVGIVQPEFRGFERSVATGVWVPVSTWKAMGNARELEERGGGQFEGIARLKPGASFEQAGAQLKSLSSRLEQEHPDTNRARRLVAVTHDAIEHGSGPTAPVILLSAVGIVLLIACANVAMLLLAQAEGREHEITVRLALGASQWRVVRQLLTEGAVLALLGGAVALLVTYWIIPVLPAMLPPGPEFIKYDIRMDRRVVLVAGASCVGTVFLFGLAPALSAARRDLISALKGRGLESRRRTTGRYALVATQAALTVLLVTAAGLLARTFYNSLQQRLGFDTGRNMLVLNTGLSARGNQAAATVCDGIVDRLQALPGVRQAAYARRVPLGLFGEGATRDILIPGNPSAAGKDVMRMRFNQISPGYLRTMGTRIVSGRGFTRSDNDTTVRVALVNQTMLRTFWPDGNAVGRHILVDKKDTEIVGVVEDGVIAGVQEPPEPFLLFPFAQAQVEEVTFIMETAGDPATLLGPAKTSMKQADPGIMLFVASTMKRHVADALYSRWLPAVLSIAMGALGLVLGAAGLFGVVLQNVNRRVREIGIRTTLGATRRRVVVLVIRHGLLLAGTGAAAGAAASVASGRLLGTMLYGITPYDAPTILFSVAVVLAVALAASAYPAWKATRVDPADILRTE
jgi:predicted permease